LMPMSGELIGLGCFKIIKWLAFKVLTPA